MKNNINLQPNYCNQVWDKENTATWRRYPGCFGRISWAVGHLNEVLELGCGAGILARKLLEFGNTVTALDISEVAIAQLPKEIKGVVSTLSPYGYIFIETFIDEFMASLGQLIALPTMLAVLYTPT